MRAFAGARCSGTFLFSQCVKPGISTDNPRIGELASGIIANFLGVEVLMNPFILSGFVLKSLFAGILTSEIVMRKSTLKISMVGIPGVSNKMEERN